MNNLQPHDVDAERALLGAILLDPASALDVDLRAEYFFAPKHRVIFDAIGELLESGQDVDPITLGSQLNGRLEAAGRQVNDRALRRWLGPARCEG